MGKAWKTASVSGVLTMSTFAIYVVSAPKDWFYVPLLVISIIAATIFVVSGIVYLILLIQKRLNPLSILEDVRCTYWPKEKQVGVTLWFCDYSNSPEFEVLCLAQFGSQTVNVDSRRQLDGTYIGNTYCRGGRKRMVEFLKNDVAVLAPNKCLVAISIKPLGIWATKKKSKEVDTLVVNH
jgi:hypothetical protein